MRIIQTTFYLDPADDLWDEPPDAQFIGLTVAWFKAGNAAVYPDLARIIRDPLSFRGMDVREDMLNNADFLNLLLMSADPETSALFYQLLAGLRTSPERPFLPLRINQNPRMVEYILDQTVILERSPPFEIPLRGLIGDSANIVIGSYIGWDAAAGNDLMLLITVPGGIIAVGAAIGISNALQRGLAKSIAKFLAG